MASALASLVGRPIHFKNVEDVLHAVVAALLDHEAALQAAHDEAAAVSARARAADAHIAELQRGTVADELKALRTELAVERAHTVADGQTLRAVVDHLAARLGEMEHRLGVLEQSATAHGAHVNAPPAADGVAAARDMPPPTSSDVLLERLETLEHAARESQRERLADADELSARVGALERALVDVRTRAARRDELPSPRASGSASASDVFSSSGAPPQADAPVARPRVSLVRAGSGRLDAGHVAGAAPACVAPPAAPAVLPKAALTDDVPLATELDPRRLLREVELLRAGQAHNQNQLMTLALQLAALADGRQPPPPPQPRVSASAAGCSAGGAGSAASPLPLGVAALVEGLEAARAQLAHHERMLHALAHGKADAAKVEAALDDKADASMLLHKVDRQFCEGLIGRLSERLSAQLGSVEASVEASAGSMREQLEAELAASAARARDELIAQRRVRQLAGDAQPGGGGDDEFAVLWVSRLSDPPNRPHGAVKAAPIFVARPLSRPASAAVGRLERAQSPPAGPADAHDGDSAGGGTRARPQSAHARAEQRVAPLTPSVFNESVRGAEAAAAEYARTGQFGGRKLRADQVAGGHFNASARQSPAAERVGPWQQPVRSRAQQPRAALSGLDHAGEVERLRERAREARERALREAGKLQPTNGPPVQKERRTQLGRAPSAAALAPHAAAVAVGTDGRFYHFADDVPALRAQQLDNSLNVLAPDARAARAPAEPLRGARALGGGGTQPTEPGAGSEAAHATHAPSDAASASIPLPATAPATHPPSMP